MPNYMLCNLLLRVPCINLPPSFLESPVQMSLPHFVKNFFILFNLILLKQVTVFFTERDGSVGSELFSRLSSRWAFLAD